MSNAIKSADKVANDLKVTSDDVAGAIKELNIAIAAYKDAIENAGKKPTSEPSEPSKKPAKKPPVKNSITLSTGEKVITSLPGSYSSGDISGFVATTPLATANKGLECAAGQNAHISVTASQMGVNARECVDNAIAVLKNNNAGVVVGSELDILAGRENKNGTVDPVNQSTEPISFMIGIPKEFVSPGYDYSLIRVESDGTVTTLLDTDTDPNTISFDTDGFGVFVLVKTPSPIK